MASGVYKITNKINGHCYIGSAVNIKNRWKGHRSDLSKNKHHSNHLQNAWNKYGADAFEFSVIEYCPVSSLIARENYYLNPVKPEYNISPTAGNCLGVKHTDKSRARMSDAQQNRSLEWRTKISEGLKAIMTPERRAQMSKITKASMTPDKLLEMSTSRKAGMTPERRQEISERNKGMKHSDESKSKMSASRIGHLVSLETRAKMSAANTGKKRTSETCARISAANKRREPATPETRTRMSMARKAIDTPEYRAKLSAGVKTSMTPERRAKISAQTKANRTPELRAKVSAKLKGRVDSTETRAKKSVSIKEWWAKKKSGTK
jgi:group I intron endonuclease